MRCLWVALVMVSMIGFGIPDWLGSHIYRLRRLST